MEEQVSELNRSVRQLGSKVGQVAVALERQNDLRRRLVTGIVFGVGTAIGASVIASIIIILSARLLAPVGIDLISAMNQYKNVLETQIESQTPQQ